MKRVFFWILLLSGIVWGRNFIDFEEAKIIASNYKKAASEKIFKNWRESNISSIEKFYDINGNVVGYEVSLSDKNGFFFISNDKNTPLIPFVSGKGSSMQETLKEYEKKIMKDFERNGVSVKDKRYFLSLPICYGVGFRIVEKENLSVLESADFQKGWYIFSPLKECAKIRYETERKRSVSSYAKENEKLKAYLLNPDKKSDFFKNIKVKFIPFKKSRISKDMGGYNFSNFYQEFKSWNNGECMTGCTPVAWGILLEYWDRHGFGNLVGTIYDNNNRDLKDPDVSYMLTRLRLYLGTFCNGRNGSTHGIDTPKGIDYVYERGYYDSVAYRITKNEPLFNVWITLMDNINRNYPVIANMYQPEWKNGHSTTAYGYIDEEGEIGDFFCVKTGWRDPTDKCFSSRYLTDIVEVYINKPQNIPPIADAGRDKRVVIGNSVVLDGSGSRDEDGYIKEYVWSVNGHILGYGEKITVTPPSVGRFTIKLTVTDNDGLSDEDTMILTVVSSNPAPAPYPSPKPTVSGAKMIVSALNGYCIDIAKADRSMGAKLITWECHGGENQIWYYENGEIKSALNGYCIDIKGANSSAGAELITWRCHGGSNQKWYYENGEIRSALNGYCIDIAKANPYPGASLIVWPCHGGSNQKWSFR